MASTRVILTILRNSRVARGSRGANSRTVRKSQKTPPNSKVFNAACVDFDYTDPQVTMTYSNLMSLVPGAFKDPAREARTYS